MTDTCGFCRGMRLEPSRLCFPCPECGRRMLRVVEPDMGGDVFHCPEHCATLIPTPAMVESAERDRAHSARNP